MHVLKRISTRFEHGNISWPGGGGGGGGGEELRLSLAVNLSSLFGLQFDAMFTLISYSLC